MSCTLLSLHTALQMDPCLLKDTAPATSRPPAPHRRGRLPSLLPDEDSYLDGLMHGATNTNLSCTQRLTEGGTAGRPSVLHSQLLPVGPVSPIYQHSLN